MSTRPRPQTKSHGNSLTSISSLTTLPPSPIAERNICVSVHERAISGEKPTAIDVDPLGILHGPERSTDLARTSSPPGSVPSPRPRLTRLHESAPSRPRLDRPMSSPCTHPHTRHSLNPASQTRPTSVSYFNLLDGSVPHPKPNRLFTSVYYHPLSSPATTIPILRREKEPKGRFPPRLRTGQKGSAPRKTSPPGSSKDGTIAGSSEAVRATSSDQTSNTSLTGAPCSFSEFVESIGSLR
jgi:hypothetical protein